MEILLLLLNGRHLLADAAQSPSRGSLSTGRLVFEAAVLPVRRTVANRMLRLEIALLATSRKAGCDEDGVLPRAGGGGQKAEGNGAGAKELTLRRWTKNSLFPEECQVNSVARTQQQQRGTHTSTITATRADGCSDTGSGTVGRAAAPLFFWMGQYTETSLNLQEFRSTATQLCAARTCLLRRLVCYAHSGGLIRLIVMMILYEYLSGD